MNKPENLELPPPEVFDSGLVRMGSGSITAQFPPLRPPPAEVADPGVVRIGNSSITAKFPPRPVRRVIAPALLAATLLLACTPQQLATGREYHDKIVYVCKQAMAVAPMFPSVAPWLIGACQTEAAIAKLALDPDSLGWLTGILGRL